MPKSSYEIEAVLDRIRSYVRDGGFYGTIRLTFSPQLCDIREERVVKPWDCDGSRPAPSPTQT